MAKGKVGKAFKNFFSSLWEDFKHLFTEHFFRLIGFVIMFIVPVIVLLTTYVEKVEGATKYSIPFGVILPLGILLLVYWGKLRRYLSVKVSQMKTENNIEKGKHAGAIIICDIFSTLMTITPFVICYVVLKELEKYLNNVSDIFVFLIICESVGGLFIIIDTIKNVIDFSDEEVKELEEEVLDTTEENN